MLKKRRTWLKLGQLSIKIKYYVCVLKITYLHKVVGIELDVFKQVEILKVLDVLKKSYYSYNFVAREFTFI